MSALIKGNVAVVTGGATGIGFAIAEQLAARGMHLVLAGRRIEKLEEAADKLKPHGVEILPVACNVRQRAQVRALASRANAAFGRTDLLVANAGGSKFGRLRDFDDDAWDEAIETNFLSATYAVQAFYPAMAERGSGAILITGSQTALPPDWALNHGPYIACKAGLLALGLQLRHEAALYGVNVSVLVPASTLSEMHMETIPAGSPHAFAMNPELPKVKMSRKTAEEVARRALAGLDDNDAIIATHPEMAPFVRNYCDRLLGAYEKAAMFGG